MLETPKPFFYLAARQNRGAQNINVRSALSPEAMARALLREIHALDPKLRAK